MSFLFLLFAFTTSSCVALHLVGVDMNNCLVALDLDSPTSPAKVLFNFTDINFYAGGYSSGWDEKNRILTVLGRTPGGGGSTPQALQQVKIFSDLSANLVGETLIPNASYFPFFLDLVSAASLHGGGLVAVQYAQQNPSTQQLLVGPVDLDRGTVSESTACRFPSGWLPQPGSSAFDQQTSSMYLWLDSFVSGGKTQTNLYRCTVDGQSASEAVLVVQNSSSVPQNVFIDTASSGVVGYGLDVLPSDPAKGPQSDHYYLVKLDLTGKEQGPPLKLFDFYPENVNMESAAFHQQTGAFVSFMGAFKKKRSSQPAAPAVSSLYQFTTSGKLVSKHLTPLIQLINII